MLKIFIYSILFFLPFSVFAQKDTTFALTHGWTFSLNKEQKSCNATVPGSIYNDLLGNELISDPFTGNHEQALQWISDSVWYYKYTLVVEERLLLNQHIELEFEGLDTYSEVSINDSLIFVANNAFRTWKTEIKKLLRPGINEIKIKFEPVSKKAKSEVDKLKYPLPGGDRSFVRKPQFQFGWDFAPRFLGCGIWKPVKITAWNGLKVQDVYMIQNNLSEKAASFTADIEIKSDVTNDVSIVIIDKDTGKQMMSSVRKLVKGTNHCKIDFVVENPRLWWCNGMGKPEMYDFEIKVSDRYLHSEVYPVSVGIRKTEWVQEPDSLGKSFYLKLNGVPVFVKGSNVVPLHVFPAKADSSAYKRLIKTVVDCNMNMLRVWGGGIYEKDIFYELCDRNGILVWQDFMFAGTVYPGDSVFVNNVKAELKDNITRLRNHPCIALWCGNNEVSEGWHNWEWQKQYKYSLTDSLKIWNDYQDLFEKIIPQMVNRYDSARFYWPSSPSVGWGRKESLLSGDSHYWGVWWGNEPFEAYKSKIGRFMSEYGFQGLPSYKSVQTMAGTLKPEMSDEEVKNHQKHPAGFEIIYKYLQNDYSPPADFSDFIYKSQLLQAGGITTAIEAHRKARPYCMGTMYWQLNDCWPGISWSGIDFYGRRKAVQYFVKKEFKNIIITIDEVQDTLLICVVSDEAKTIQKKIKMKLMTFDGKLLWDKEIPVEVKPWSVSDVYKVSVKEIIKKSDKSSILFAAGFSDEPKSYIKTHYFVKNKELKLKPVEISANIEESKEGSVLLLKSEYLVKNISVNFKGENMEFEDNYYDMLPGETYPLHCNKKLIKSDLPEVKFNYLVNP